LVVINDFDLVRRPSQFFGAIGERVLPCGRFTMFEHLVLSRLTHVDDGESIQMLIENLVASAITTRSMLRLRRNMLFFWLSPRGGGG